MEKLGPHQIQWYPGHIAKHERELGERLKLVDVVVEVLDARLPITTTTRRLESVIRNRPTVLVLNTADLADPAVTERWKKELNRCTLPGVFKTVQTRFPRKPCR